MTGRVAVILGTRPEIIKLAPVLGALGERAWPVFTGQHVDPDLTDAVFRSCGLEPTPAAVAGVGGRPRAVQISAMIDQLSGLFGATRPDVVVVQGDTNTTNAGAQAAHYASIPLVHVEAGLRSYDRGMPEEINRQLVSVLADAHCCATAGNALTLLESSSIDPAAVHITGNPIVEAVQATLPSPPERRRVAARFGLDPDAGLVLATVHRPENTDDAGRLVEILRQLAVLAGRGLQVVLPLHPRTAARMATYGLAPGRGVRLVRPVDHRTFLALAAQALVVVSDSGGLQEEVSVLRVPMVVVRTSTERPESVEAGFAVLSEPAGIVEAVAAMTSVPARLRIACATAPFGDGRAAARIARIAVQLADAADPPEARQSAGCAAIRGL